MEVELQGAGIRRGYVRGGSRAAGGVTEGQIRLRQPLTGQGARAHDAGLQGLLLAAVALTRGAEKSTGSHRRRRNVAHLPPGASFRVASKTSFGKSACACFTQTMACSFVPDSLAFLPMNTTSSTEPKPASATKTNPSSMPEVSLSRPKPSPRGWGIQVR